MNKIELCCEYCKKKFEKDIGEYKSIIKSGRNYFFCSFPCGNKYNQIQIRKKSIQKYYENPNLCLHCGKIIPVPEKVKVNEIRKKKFCDNSCSAKYYNPGAKRKKVKHCRYCQKELNHRRKKYCDLNCKLEFEYKTYIQKWKQKIESGNTKNGASAYIKRYFFEKNNNKCEECGWGKMNSYTKKIPLQMHHVDGNYLNNNEDNLKLLCLNCHSLTATYGGRNKGKGRESRRKYRLKKKNECG